MSERTTQQFDHWQLSIDEDNILWLGINCKEKSVNSLSRQAVIELSTIVTYLSTDKLTKLNINPKTKLKGIVIYSVKKTGFIAGADVTEFKGVDHINTAKDILQNGQNAMNSLARLKIPTVAMIDGFCLGGGYELALACDYRVASDSSSTKIGLPEVLLGIVPGWGGTVRLSRLISGVNALPLIMQGKTLAAKQAAKIGMIDAAVPLRQLKKAAVYYINNKPALHKPSWLHSLCNHQPFRNIFNYFAYKQLAKKVQKQHYPAPFAALHNWQKYGVEGDKPFFAEIDSNLTNIQHPTTKNLIRLFFLQEKLKEEAKQSEFDPRHIHVIGAGTMGGDIAAWCAYKGMKVTLQDRNYDSLVPALNRASKLFKKKLKQDDLVKLTLDRIIPDVTGNGIYSADLIIEAVFEDLKVKQDLFKDIENKAKKNAILATNTSSILLDEINKVLHDPSRLVGIHFFNPVASMMLVEVVKGKKTNDKVFADSSSFVNKLSKLPVPVASSPGFLVNRILAEYMHETFILLSEGNKPESIDFAMKQFGMFMGPVEMADIVGLDICLSVAKNIAQYSNEPVPKILEQMVAEKKLGKKTNQGFYNYSKGRIVRSKSYDKLKSEEIIERLTMRTLNTCVSCIRENIVSDDNLVDAALIFGAGFAPFRGGPMNYLNDLGKENVYRKLQKLESLYGVRFKPDAGFKNLEHREGDQQYDKACG